MLQEDTFWNAIPEQATSFHFSHKYLLYADPSSLFKYYNHYTYSFSPARRTFQISNLFSLKYNSFQYDS